MAAKKLKPFCMKVRANTGNIEVDTEGGIIGCTEMIASFMPLHKQQQLIDRLQARLDEEYAKSTEYDQRKDLQCWFGLSYATFLVLPRVAMEQMPEAWQMRMAELLNQYDETINTSAFGVKGCSVRATDANGKLMKMPEELLNYRHPTPETKAELLSK